MLKLCGLLEKIRHGLPSSQISKKNQKRRSVSSQIRFDPFPHLRGHFGDARTSRMHNGPYSPKGKKWRPRAPGGIMPR